MAEIAIALVQNAKPIDMSLIIYEIKGHTVWDLTFGLTNPRKCHVQWNGADEAGNVISRRVCFIKL